VANIKDEMLDGIEKLKKEIEVDADKLRLKNVDLKRKQRALQLWWNEKKTYKKKDKSESKKEDGTNTFG